MTATSVVSVSAEPPLLIFSISTLSSSSPTLTRAETVVVHLLDVNDIDVAKLGAARGTDRFAQQHRWSRLPTGEPVFGGVRVWVRCAVVDRMHAGTSTVIAAHALESHVERALDVDEPTDALVYHNRTWHRLSEQSRVDD